MGSKDSFGSFGNMIACRREALISRFTDLLDKQLLLNHCELLKACEKLGPQASVMT